MLKNQLRQDLGVTLFLLGLVVFLMHTALSFPARARFSPMFIGSITVALLLIQVFFSYRRMKTAEEKGMDQEDVQRLKRLFGLIFALVLIVPSIYFFGLLATAAVALTLYFSLYVRLALHKSLLMSLTACVLVYVVFAHYFSIRIPPGILW